MGCHRVATHISSIASISDTVNVAESTIAAILATLGCVPNPRPDVSGLTPGGKSLTGGDIHSPRITISVPAEWKARLEAAASHAGIGTSKLVREIIGEWLAGHASRVEASGGHDHGAVADS